MSIEIRAVKLEDLAAFMLPAYTALGFVPHVERIEQMKTVPELVLRLVAFDGEQAVGSAGTYAFSLTVPGGKQVELAGLTMVGVLPTHRRRGILTQLIRQHFEDARGRKRPLSALFASEGTIYRRFGYGAASLAAEIEIERAHTAFVKEVKLPRVQARLIEEDEAAALFPAIYERVRLRTPGMLSRSPAWWRVRRIGDPSWIRAGRAPLQRVLLMLDGKAAAYAIYRLLDSGWDSFNINTLSVEVTEAVGDSPAATAALWRYLFDLDLSRHIKARLLPADHPLFFLLADARRLRMRMSDALWVRLIDVKAALSARGYERGEPLTLAVTDSFCPWNQGRFRLQDGVAERTEDAADLALSVDALGSLYLGGFRASQLAQAGLVTEIVPGALRRAEAIFGSAKAPWTPDIF